VLPPASTNVKAESAPQLTLGVARAPAVTGGQSSDVGSSNVLAVMNVAAAVGAEIAVPAASCADSDADAAAGAALVSQGFVDAKELGLPSGCCLDQSGTSSMCRVM